MSGCVVPCGVCGIKSFSDCFFALFFGIIIGVVVTIILLSGLSKDYVPPPMYVKKRDGTWSEVKK